MLLLIPLSSIPWMILMLAKQCTMAQQLPQQQQLLLQMAGRLLLQRDCSSRSRSRRRRRRKKSTNLRSKRYVQNPKIYCTRNAQALSLCVCVCVCVSLSLCAYISLFFVVFLAHESLFFGFQDSSQVLQRKRRGKSRKLPQQEEAANSVTEHLKVKLDSSSSPPENVVMPPQKQVGLEADVKHIDLKDLVVADSVYNKELRHWSDTAALLLLQLFPDRNPTTQFLLLAISFSILCVCVCLSDPFMIFAAGWHLTGGCFTWHLMFRLLCLRYNKWTSIHLFHDWSFGCQTQWICCRFQLLFLIYLLSGFFPNDKKTVTAATLTHWDVPTYVVDLCLCDGFSFAADTVSCNFSTQSWWVFLQTSGCTQTTGSSRSWESHHSAEAHGLDTTTSAQECGKVKTYEERNFQTHFVLSISWMA